MEVNDRGTMKWVSLMLPEHVEMLKTVFVESKKKPILDEQKMIEMDQNLKYALKHQVNIEITYYEDGDFSATTGRLVKVDQSKGNLILWNEDGINIRLKNIVDVEVL